MSVSIELVLRSVSKTKLVYLCAYKRLLPGVPKYPLIQLLCFGGWDAEKVLKSLRNKGHILR